MSRSNNETWSTNRYTNTRHSALVFGSLASIFFGFWGFFNKLSGSQSIYVTNFIIYGTAFILSLPGFIRTRTLALTGIAAGICGGVINGLILFALLRHNLILVYPFISAGTLVFVGLSFFFLGGKFSSQNYTKLTLGSFLAIAGLALCAIGFSGGIGSFGAVKVESGAIFVGILISLLTGLWNFLAFVTVTRKNLPSLPAATNIFLGSLLVSSALLFFNAGDISRYKLSGNTIYSILSGIFVFMGSYAAFNAFRSVPKDTQRLEQALAVFLCNSELLPILFLSTVFLGERSIEGLIGAVMVLGGVTLLNFAGNEG